MTDMRLKLETCCITSSNFEGTAATFSRNFLNPIDLVPLTSPAKKI